MHFLQPRYVVVVLAVCLALAHALTLSAPAGMGWDEAMHHAQPAARMALALREGHASSYFDALHDCAQYPPLIPWLTAWIEWPLGVSEALARALGSVWLGLAAWLAYRCGERLAGVVAGAAAFLLVAASPLAWSYGSTLFLELPFVALCLWALERVLVLCAAPNSTRAQWWAGIAIACLPFAKWNYGLLAAAALWLTVWFAVGRTVGLFASGRHLWRVVLPFSMLAVWWWLLPLPFGFERAAEHRQALLGFLQGNTEVVATPWSTRLLYASGGLVRHPLALVLVLACLCLAVRRAGSGKVWLLAAALVVPVLVHPFHLDRFQLVWLAPLAPLVGVGFAVVYQRFGRAALGVLLMWGLPLPLAQAQLASWLGVLADKPEVRAYQVTVLDERTRLGAARSTPTAGLPRAALSSIVDSVAQVSGPDARLAWIGVSSELSPATLNLELLARGRSAVAFEQAANVQLDLSYFGERVLDEKEAATALLALCADRDLVLWSTPSDFKERPERAWLAHFAARVPFVVRGSAVELPGVELPRPLRAPLAVTMHAWRVQR
jgi:hypothetical protein